MLNNIDALYTHQPSPEVLVRADAGKLILVAVLRT
jgi:hypothetical protein